MVAFLDAGHTRPNIDDNACALVAQDRWEQPFRIGAGERELVRVADTGGFHLDQDFAGFWPVQLDVRDRERLGFLECNGGMVFMAISSSASRSARVELEDTGAKITRWERGPRNGAMAAKLNSVSYGEDLNSPGSRQWR